MGLPDTRRLIERLETYEHDSIAQNYHAQAHARSILLQLKSPESGWPHFKKDLDEKLYYGAHFQMWAALELLDKGEGKAAAQQALLNGAEALEFLCDNPNLEPALRSEQLLKAAFSYYVAGHYARSYVLINDLLAGGANIPRPIALLVAILQKQLRIAREITLSIFSDRAYLDSQIEADLNAAEIDPDDVVSRVISVSLASAVSLYLEYLKTGERPLFDESLATVSDMVSLAKKTLFVDWWWWSYCLRHLLLEYNSGCLWTQLNPLSGGESDSLVPKYIRAGLRKTPPVVELWPSQAQAVPIINRPDRPSFCLKMPTSSGKTITAEVTMLQFFIDNIDNQHKKCAYIAPFRSLAVEVEKTLRKSVGPLGTKVSEIYGGFDLSPDDRRLIEETHILVATPEKFDALFRFAPEIASNIGLVIIDEGHVLNLDERGLHFEFFLQRLIKRLKPSGCRFLFISAVLPNAAEFSEWITGTPNSLLESKWRPSRLMLGRLSWDGRTVRVDYTHSERDQFEQECFVPGFISTVSCIGVPGLGRRTLPFPKDKDEAIGAAALQFAQTGTTLIFCPQKRQVQSFAEKLRETLRVRKALSSVRNETFELPKPGIGTLEWDYCKKTIAEEMGPHSSLLELLEEGIVVHHSGLPQRVRVAIEDLVRSRGCQLLVATTTLAQGVNLPIKTVLVRGLYHGQNDLVSPLTFWNICGRAGRGMKENAGQILFCVDKTGRADQTRRTNSAIEKMISAIDKQRVVSALRAVLNLFVRKWRQLHPGIELSELCVYLAENNLQWIPESNRPEFRYWLDKLDAHLLALAEDFNLEPYTPDELQNILSGSLLFIQLRDEPEKTLTADDAVSVCGARIEYIEKRFPQRRVRSRFFKLGLPLEDCESIESRKDELLSLFLEASEWLTWSDDKQIQYLFQLAEIVLQLREIRPRKGVPAQFLELLVAWLSGHSPTQMASDTEISKFSEDPTEISLWIEDICRYRLPWGVNSLTAFLQSYAIELGQNVPEICSHFTSMFKYGLVDPIAVRLISCVDQDRELAIILARACPHNLDRLSRVPAWFKKLTKDDLLGLGMDGTVIRRVIELQEAYIAQQVTKKQQTLSIQLPFSDRTSTGGLSVGDRVLVIPRGDREPSLFELWTTKGKLVGVFSFLDHPVPEWWKRLDLVISEITDAKMGHDGKPLLVARTSEV